jgi:hypothetical protein
MRTSLTQSVDDLLEIKHFQYTFFNNLTTDKCGCLWYWTSSLRRNSLIHADFKLGMNLTGLSGLSAASEKQVLTLKFMTNM